MKIKKYIAGSILVLAMLACAGQPVPTTFDPNTIPTMVGLTANAAMTQTAVVASSPLPAEAATPSLEGTTLEQLPNGSTKYINNQIGFEITFPEGWLTVRPNSEEFNAAYSKDAAKNPLLLGQMDYDVSTYEVGFDQLHSYALRPDIEKNFLFGYSSVRWDSQDTLSLNEATMGELARELETSGAIPGFRVDTVQIYKTSNNIEVIEIGGQFSRSDGQDGVIPFYMTAIFFKPTADTLTRITFTYLQDYKVQLSIDVNKIINSIKLLGQ